MQDLIDTHCHIHDPEFAKKMDVLRKKNARYIEILGTWDKPKK